MRSTMLSCYKKHRLILRFLRADSASDSMYTFPGAIVHPPSGDVTPESRNEFALHSFSEFDCMFAAGGVADIAGVAVFNLGCCTFSVCSDD